MKLNELNIIFCLKPPGPVPGMVVSWSLSVFLLLAPKKVKIIDFLSY